MSPEQFAAQLRAEGFAPIVTVEREPGAGLDEHVHPFAAKALILDGEITIATGHGERRYTVGQVFHLAANQPHAERYGPAGVRYLVGRKS